MGETLVGSCQTIEIPLVNKSPCPVSFSLSVQQIIRGDEHTYDAAAEQSGISFCGTLHDIQKLSVTFFTSGKKVTEYKLNISV